MEKLCTGIDQALARIDQYFLGQDWSIVSSLAEGADRLVVERVLAYRPTARLIVPLPLPVEAYQIDFASTESQQEFRRTLTRAHEIIRLPQAASREEAYRAAGVYMVDRSSMLIALWDGEGVQGKGGTGEIVAMARERGLPLAWVQCGNRRPKTTNPVSLGDRQGKVIFERL